MPRTFSVGVGPTLEEVEAAVDAVEVSDTGWANALPSDFDPAFPTLLEFAGPDADAFASRVAPLLPGKLGVAVLSDEEYAFKFDPAYRAKVLRETA